MNEIRAYINALDELLAGPDNVGVLWEHYGGPDDEEAAIKLQFWEEMVTSRALPGTNAPYPFEFVSDHRPEEAQGG